MKKRIAVIFVILMCAAFGLLLAGFRPWLKPTVLDIHISGGAWTQVVIEKAYYYPGRKVFNPGDTLSLSPIEYGPYKVSVEYENGDTLWVGYFHCDAGVRRKIDMYFEGNPKAGPIKITEIVNGKDVHFDGPAMPSKTSYGSPLLIDWI